MKDRGRALTLKCMGGSREADLFVRVYEAHFDAVYGYLRATLGSADEAEDATQQVFLKAYEALPRYRPGERPLGAWLLRIARNHAVDRLRRRKHAPLGEPREHELALEQPMDSDDHLRALVDELPLLQRQVVVLRFTLGYSPAEVADILGRSHGAVRQAQYRALRMLEHMLAEPQPELALAG